jgi:two-component system response regulator HydG
MTNTRILIVEDDPTLRAFLNEVAKDLGCLATCLSRGDTALTRVSTESFGIVLTDVKLPGADGLQILKATKKRNPECEVILMTAFATVDMAIDAMKSGAREFLQKPFTSELAEAVIRGALERIALKQEVKALSRQIPHQQLIGRDTGLKDVCKIVLQVAAGDANVIIYGESGVGKELIAREIHCHSSRSKRRMVILNIAAMSETMVEAELFGHEKGAFTGAIRDREGLLELADGSTLFLDEIGDLPESIQVKLLRFTQERTFRRVGSNHERQVDVRIVCATNRDLSEAVKAGEFREDLFYRLNVVPLTVPPLRQRIQDIPILVEHFIEKVSPKLRSRIQSVAPAVIKAYQKYPWPGNVRELENVISRAVTLTSGEVLESPFLDSATNRSDMDLSALLEGKLTLPKHLESIEREAIKIVLDMEGNVKARAASRLGIKRTTLIEKMNKLGLGK